MINKLIIQNNLLIHEFLYLKYFTNQITIGPLQDIVSTIIQLLNLFLYNLMHFVNLFMQFFFLVLFF